MAPAGTFTIRDFRVGSDYLVPDLVGLTVAQARDEWSHRYGYRVNTVGRPRISTKKSDGSDLDCAS